MTSAYWNYASKAMPIGVGAALLMPCALQAAKAPERLKDFYWDTDIARPRDSLFGIVVTLS